MVVVAPEKKILVVQTQRKGLYKPCISAVYVISSYH